ncbi:MAG TPA: xyloglucanase [Anaerohalosphaeraceae bacterium]|nr:xyloglucanase [Anaerohalosphaeraceae bacterium]
MRPLVKTGGIAVWICSVVCLGAQEVLPSEPYDWKPVQIVGGGFVTGFVFHPTVPGLCYARTDMGGAYRWSPPEKKWQPLLDWVSLDDVNLMGVDGLAVDPSDPNRLYLACGTYTSPTNPNGSVLCSKDKGQTFERTDLPFKLGANEDGRGSGERIAVDPSDGRILFLGSRYDGLWKSEDFGRTWKKVETFPEIPEDRSLGTGEGRRGGRPQNPGIIFVLFDPTSGSVGKGCSAIYVGVSRMGQKNLFRTDDGGQTWRPIDGQPTQYRPTHAALASDGTLYITYGSSPGPSRMSGGAVWKWNAKTGEWAEITPDKPTEQRRFGYAAVSVDASNPQVLMVSSYCRFDSGEEIFRSTDGGRTWTMLLRNSTFDYSNAPYVQSSVIHWMFDVEIDPTNPNHALFTTGYGGYETFNLSNADAGKPVHWSVMSRGIEQTVALDLLSPPAGAPLITAIGDYAGFVHWDLDRPAPEGNFNHPRFGNCTGLACALRRPEMIVRVGNGAGEQNSSIGYSLGGGRTWQPAGKPEPDSRGGSIAVCADGSVWIWTPERSAAFRSVDLGKTWFKCEGLPAGSRITADGSDPKVFYAMDLFEGRLFVSMDGGTSFAEKPLNLPGGLPKRGTWRGDWRGGQDRLYAVPGREGDLWLAAYDGLFHSADRGETFQKIKSVERICAFGFGKAAPGREYPVLYLVGIVKGQYGIFRSIDTAQSWVRINDDRHQWGLILQITGDPKQYGRVYVGTHGRGVLYGDPKN